ncbi:mitochondrial ribonuclease P protein 1 homolog isoform X1 [Manduca sexta]|uniref:mitochondrial ribonuclease P protein 1 homolog isoform X1 n=2 Tax=Manduca sexta TaxID=7130 RepID=UPI00188E97C9|nr:mitochondrial ribonuclease P protein 1 homolog isoform X1 [Manduca sexta]
MHCIRSVLSHLRRSREITPCIQRVIETKSVIHNTRFYSIRQEDTSDELVNAICKGDQDLEKKLRILMLEVEVMRQDGRCAPDTMNIDHWTHLLNLTSKNQRSTYLTYLWKNEKTRENKKAKKEAKRKELDSIIPEPEKEYPDDLLYGIKYQSLFLRIRDQSINTFDNYRALQALMHGQPVIIDCSYEEHMVWREIVNAAKQMTYVFGDNRTHKDPFNLYMCNVNMKGEFMKQMRKNIPSIEEPWFPMNVCTQSYLDIFPKEKLVYLTPHCRQELTNFDHDDVYIVGCMVDKMNNEPISLAKAKKDNIRMAKLPLDRYLEWAPGSKKNLNINHMIPILLDLKSTGDWEYALRHIPRRKLMETKILAMQKKLKNNPMLEDTVFKNFRKSNLGRKSEYFLKDRKSKSRSLYNDDVH